MMPCMENCDFANSAILDMTPKFTSLEEMANYLKKIAENLQATDFELANKLYIIKVHTSKL